MTDGEVVALRGLHAAHVVEDGLVTARENGVYARRPRVEKLLRAAQVKLVLAIARAVEDSSADSRTFGATSLGRLVEGAAERWASK